jgi:hypothetical protein
VAIGSLLLGEPGAAARIAAGLKGG